MSLVLSRFMLVISMSSTQKVVRSLYCSNYPLLLQFVRIKNCCCPRANPFRTSAQIVINVGKAPSIRRSKRKNVWTVVIGHTSLQSRTRSTFVVLAFIARDFQLHRVLDCWRWFLNYSNVRFVVLFAHSHNVVSFASQIHDKIFEQAHLSS